MVKNLSVMQVPGVRSLGGEDPLEMPGGWGLARAGAPKLGYGWGTKGKMMEPEKFIDLLWCLNHTVLKANQHQ